MQVNYLGGVRKNMNFADNGEPNAPPWANLRVIESICVLTEFSSHWMEYMPLA